jgi:hypothetical protein
MNVKSSTASATAVSPAQPARYALPWYGIVRTAGQYWLASRIVLVTATYTSILFLHANVVQGGGSTVVFPTRTSLGYVLSRWSLWDGGWYIGIARGNYPRPIEAAFFPLYPLLIRVFAFGLSPLGQSREVYLAAALIVSQLAAFGACVALAALAAHEARSGLAANGALRALTAYPFALFLAAAYTDGLFLALATSALLAGRREYWGWAALTAFLAALARPFGVALILPLGWEYAQRATHGWIQSWWRRLTWCDGLTLFGLVGAVPAGLGIYTLYCWLHWQDPLAFVHAQTQFQHVASPPWSTVAYVAQQVAGLPRGGVRQLRTLLDVLPVLGAGTVMLLGMRHRAVSLSLYGVIAVLLCLTSPIMGAQFPDALASGGRYILACSPLWLDLGRWTVRWPALGTLLNSAGWALQALLVAFVVTGGWLI